MAKRTNRSEKSIWEDLVTLCREAGYVHVIAQICRRDNLVLYTNEMQAEHLQPLFSHNRLIRTELNTLIGLMAQGSMDSRVPKPSVRDMLIAKTDALMAELHDALALPMHMHMDMATSSIKQESVNETLIGSVLREPIFYSGESAYSFQYRDLVAKKYAKDDEWLLQNKGFTLKQGQVIAETMCRLMDEKTEIIFNNAKDLGQEPASWLMAFEQSPREIAARCKVPIEIIHKFIDAFSLTGKNEDFHNLGDYNALAGTPLIRWHDEKVLLFQHYAIYEALYDAPFYWMMKDNSYRTVAQAHRGQFTESFSYQRLVSVFGQNHVHKNVFLHRRKGNSLGEIDILVVFGDRLIIVQAKSKRLTLEARSGNDGAIQRDFAAAIQESYNQAKLCADEIIAGNCELKDDTGSTISLPFSPRKFYFSV